MSTTLWPLLLSWLLATVLPLGPAHDEAVLVAIRQLPRFRSGQRQGRAVAVSFTVPVMFKPTPGK